MIDNTKYTDFTRNPYYDDYDPSKNYVKMLALPGRVEQSREFTQIQSMMLDFIKRLGDTILKEGSIVEGCDINIEDTKVSISSGKIYLNGIVRPVEQSSLDISCIGDEIIGAKLVNQIVTEVEDPSLKDPAEGYDNYGQAGAHRLKQVINIVLDDPDATPIYRLQDGTLLNAETRPQLDVVNELFARRTFDETGNYLVNGLQIVDKEEITANDKIKVSVEGGRAYVKGYEVNKPTASTILIDKSLDTRKIVAEPKVFHTGTKQYKLNNTPVKDISRILAIVEVTKNITRGNVIGGIDILPDAPVVDITTVTQSATTYVKGIDFQLTNDGIDWSLKGSEPSVGSSYSVTWRYNKVLLKDVDYKLTSNDNGEFFVDFTNVSGDLPVEGTSMSVDYDFYLARRDLISVEYTGKILVQKGDSNLLSMVSVPICNDDSILKLGTILVYPNSDKIEISNGAIKRMPIEKIYGLVNRIEALEYNQAIENLDKEAMEGEPPTELKGILTDGFINLNKGDTTHDSWDSALNPIGRYQSMSLTSDIKPLEIDSMSYTHKFKRNITNFITEEVIVSQLKATESLLVNPYSVYDRAGVVSLTPRADNNISAKITTIDGGTNYQTKNIIGWQFYNSTSWLQQESQNLINKGYTVTSSNRNELTAQSATETFKNTIIEFIEPKDVEILCENALPYADNLKVTFDGTPVTVTPLNNTYKGTEPNTLKADGQGSVKGTFRIPEGIRTGSREVVIKNSNVTASSTYEAQGIRRDVERVVKQIRMVFRPYDPLAQTFAFDSSRLLTSIGLYFSAKDPNNNVTIEIRDTVNGLPGTTVYATKVLYPGNINISSNSSVETKVVFDDPVWCEANTQYCVIIASESNTTSVYVANLGDKDIISGRYVASQPYTTGVLFTSSNAITWTPQQTRDLKFKIYSATFPNPEGIVTFKPIEYSTSIVNIISDALVSKDTKLSWEYCTDDSKTWYPIASSSDVYLPNVASKIQFRVKLVGTLLMSPVFSFETPMVYVAKPNNDGSYITKNVAVGQSFTTVKQIVDLAIPSGTSVEVKFATDTSGTTWTKAQQVSAVPVTNEYTRYTFTTTVGSGVTNFRGRIDFHTSNPLIIPKAKNFMNILK